MAFTDRHDAGRQLARALEPHLRRPAIVYALPPGGVPVAAEIALWHRLPLALVIARDVPDPLQPGDAVCAVTEAGAAVCTPEESARLDPGWLAQSLADRRSAAQHERVHYRAGRRRQSAVGRCAIVVDDGSATVLALEAALRDVRGDAPTRLIVALPVAPSGTQRRLATQCDAVVALDATAIQPGAAGACYEDFRPVTDAQLGEELARAHKAETSWRRSVG